MIGDAFCSQKMFNLGPCRQRWIGLRGGMKGLVMSKPHFLGAKSLQEKVGGLSPQEDLHITYLDIEPKLGITTGYKFRYINLTFITRPSA